MSDLPKALRERAESSISQLRHAVAEFKNVCYANSLGSESMVLTDLIWGSVPEIDPEIEIFSIDTGRLYPETYDLIERLQQRYGRSLTLYYPKTEDLEGWVGRSQKTRKTPAVHIMTDPTIRPVRGKCAKQGLQNYRE